MSQSLSEAPDYLGENAKNERFYFIDALGGLAALAVLLFHSIGYGAPDYSMRELWPFSLEAFLNYGYLGVETFFVISGFVIIHSLRNLAPTPMNLGNFLLRRYIRLGLPYSVIVILSVLLILFPVVGDRANYLPSWRAVLANLAYLQYPLDAYSIVGVAWTLCIEIQFYLFFVFLLGIQPILCLKNFDAEKRWVSLSRILLATAILLAPTVGQLKFGWFMEWWSYFVLGCLSYLSARKYISPFSILLLGVWMIGWQIAGKGLDPAQANTLNSWFELALTPLFGLLTALLLLQSAWYPQINLWSNQRVLVFLGRISYSIYLVHMLIIVPFYDLFAAQATSPFSLFIVYATGLAMALLFAAILHRLVERPSIELARRLKMSG